MYFNDMQIQHLAAMYLNKVSTVSNRAQISRVLLYMYIMEHDQSLYLNKLLCGLCYTGKYTVLLVVKQSHDY